MDWLRDILKDIIFRRTIYEFFFVAAIASFVLTIVVGLFFDIFTISSASPYVDFEENANKDPQIKYLSGVAYLLLFILIFVTFALFNKNLTDDYLTPIRNKLKGSWNFQFETFAVSLQGDISSEFLSVPTYIKVDNFGKLAMKLQQTGSDIFEPREYSINAIHLGAQSTAASLVLFSDEKMNLREGVQSPYGANQIDMVYVGKLHFDTTDDRIERMYGTWYDVNNTIFRVLRANVPQDKLLEFEASLQGGVLSYQGKLQATRIDE